MRILLIAVCIGCFSSTILLAQTGTRVLPHVLVYKTRKNYRTLVPVVLSEDKRRIVAYPGQGDLKTGSAEALPVSLHQGYLLDKRGIGLHSAFTSYTYKQYTQLKEIPSLDKLYRKIIDRNPLTELYDCGARNETNNSIAQLNNLIDNNQLKQNCKVVK